VFKLKDRGKSRGRVGVKIHDAWGGGKKRSIFAGVKRKKSGMKQRMKQRKKQPRRMELRVREKLGEKSLECALGSYTALFVGSLVLYFGGEGAITKEGVLVMMGTGVSLGVVFGYAGYKLLNYKEEAV
jgi:uncharacterized membrane protein